MAFPPVAAYPPPRYVLVLIAHSLEKFSMINVFISHAWSESEKYARFVRLLDDIFISDAWNNISIPKNEAIDISHASEVRDEIKTIEDEIIHTQAKLKDPKLPDVSFRTIYDAHGNKKEVDTRGSVLRDLKALISRRNEIDSSSSLTDFSFGSKSVASTLSLHPTLGNEIRRRIMRSNLI